MLMFETISDLAPLDALDALDALATLDSLHPLPRDGGRQCPHLRHDLCTPPAWSRQGLSTGSAMMLSFLLEARISIDLDEA